MSVCAHVHAYVCMYACIYSFMYGWLYIHVCICLNCMSFNLHMYALEISVDLY